MRRYLLLLLVAMLVLIPTSLVFAQGTYRAEISVTDNTSTDRYGVGSLIPFNSEGAVSLGQMLSTGLDTRMFEGTTEIDYMVADDKLGIFIPSLVANQERSYKFETGYTPANGSFGIIPGYGGYITVTDNATLDITNNGTYQYNGYVNTDNVGSDIFRKGDFAGYVSSAGSITTQFINTANSTWTSPTADTTAWGNPANAYDDNTATYADRAPGGAGTFSYEATHAGTVANSVRWWASDTLTVTVFKVEVYYDGEYHTAYQTDGTYTQGAWVSAPIPELTSKTCTKIQVSWTVTGGGAGLRLYELDFGLSEVKSLTASGLDPDGYAVEVSLDTVDYSLSIDGMVKDTELLAGSSIVNSPSNLVIMSDATPYADNFSIEKAGVQVLLYAPNDIISGTTMPNRASTGDDGVITWGSNVGEDIEIGGLKTISSYISTSVESSLPPVVVSAPGDITGFYPEEEDIEAMPFYDLFYRAVTGDHGLGWTTNTLYGVMGIFVGIGIGVGVAVATGSALLAAIAVGIGLAVAAGTGTVGYWVVLVYALFAGTFIVVSRSM